MKKLIIPLAACFLNHLKTLRLSELVTLINLLIIVGNFIFGWKIYSLPPPLYTIKKDSKP